MSDDVLAALGQVQRVLEAKHPHLSITQRENSVDSKAFLHVWKPISPSPDTFQGLKYLPCFHVVVSAEHDPDNRDFNVLFQCYSYHGKLLEFDLTWLSTIEEFEFKSLVEMARGSIQICKGVNKTENVSPQQFLVECFGEEILVRSRDCTFMVSKAASGSGANAARCPSCSKVDRQMKATRPCPHCHKEIHERALTKHIQTQHGSSSSIVDCPICRRKVKRDGMKKHVEAVHKKSFKCLRCDKKATSVIQISKHLQKDHGVDVVKSTDYQVGLTKRDFDNLAAAGGEGLPDADPKLPLYEFMDEDGYNNFTEDLPHETAAPAVVGGSVSVKNKNKTCQVEESSQNFMPHNEPEVDFFEGPDEVKFDDDANGDDDGGGGVDQDMGWEEGDMEDDAPSSPQQGPPALSPPKGDPANEYKNGLKTRKNRRPRQWEAEKIRNVSFHCKICMKTHKNPMQVKECIDTHKEGSNLDEPTKCTTCDQTLLSRYAVTDHFRKHHRDVLFGQMCCAICMKMFPLKQTSGGVPLHAHINTNHGIRNVFCKICTKPMKNHNEEMRHWKMHKKYGIEPEALLRCPVCQRELAKGELNAHFKKVHSPDECICVECFRLYDTAEKLRIHLLTSHHYHKKGEKKHVCDQCSQAFGHVKSLEGHINKVHKGLITNTCQECNKTFHHHHLYYAHMKNVHYARGLKCVHCAEVHQTRHSLYSHLMTHTHLTPYSCLCCDYKTSTKGDIQAHFESAHQDLQFNMKYVGYDRKQYLAIKEIAGNEADAAVEGISN